MLGLGLCIARQLPGAASALPGLLSFCKGETLSSGLATQFTGPINDKGDFCLKNEEFQSINSRLLKQSWDPVSEPYRAVERIKG